MTFIHYDHSETIDLLTKAGVPLPHAQIMFKVFQEKQNFDFASLATKNDLELVKSHLRADFQISFANSERDLSDKISSSIRNALIAQTLVIILSIIGLLGSINYLK